jgi:hypothetical protein
MCVWWAQSDMPSGTGLLRNPLVLLLATQEANRPVDKAGNRRSLACRIDSPVRLVLAHLI